MSFPPNWLTERYKFLKIVAPLLATPIVVVPFIAMKQDTHYNSEEIHNSSIDKTSINQRVDNKTTSDINLILPTNKSTLRFADSKLDPNGKTVISSNLKNWNLEYVHFKTHIEGEYTFKIINKWNRTTDLALSIFKA